MLPAVGKLAPLTAGDLLSEQHDFFYAYDISLIDIDTIVFILHRGASLPTAGSIPKRSCLKKLSCVATLASRHRSFSGGTFGPVTHDRFFKQLLFGVLPAVGKLAPLTAGDFLSEQYDFFYAHDISLINIDSIVFILHRGASLPTAGSIPKRSCLNNLSWMPTLASRHRSFSGGTLD